MSISLLLLEEGTDFRLILNSLGILFHSTRMCMIHILRSFIKYNELLYTVGLFICYARYPYTLYNKYIHIGIHTTSPLTYYIKYYFLGLVYLLSIKYHNKELIKYKYHILLLYKTL